MLRKLCHWLGLLPNDKMRHDARIARLRASGMRIGTGCQIYSDLATTEPWLIEIGDRVGIAGGVKFITHDGAAFRLRHRRAGLQSLGRVRVGDDVFIGENALLLPGTEVGAGAIIGPGAVVRGRVDENVLVFGNPAQVVGRASLYLERLLRSPDALDSYGLPEGERRALVLKHFGNKDR